jgi:hypothetical protein
MYNLTLISDCRQRPTNMSSTHVLLVIGEMSVTDMICNLRELDERIQNDHAATYPGFALIHIYTLRAHPVDEKLAN